MLKFRLDCDGETRRRLTSYIQAINEVADWMALEAWIAQTFRRFALAGLCYHRAREVFGLRSDATNSAIAKVAAAYKNRNSHSLIRIRPLGAVEFHIREIRIDAHARRIRIAISGGHAMCVMVGRDCDFNRLQGLGQPTLSVSDGRLFISIPVEVKTPEPHAETVTGYDLGIANIATSSEGERLSGAALRGVRYRRKRLRSKLQAKGTRSAKRRLKRLRRRESRFIKDVNHCISKRIVADAERTNSAVALEDLKGIGGRVRASSKAQRYELTSWSFGQLQKFITYKAALAGVPVILVDPRNSSRECSQCGHVDKKNRPNQATFKCRLCAFTAHADFNAAVVIRERGRALVSAPYAAGGLTHLASSPSLGN